MSGPSRPQAPRARAKSNPAELTLLDRVVRGRLWIVMLATALLGLVFLQVSLLKLNSGIGRAVQTSQTLERQNQVMRTELSRLDSGERIQAAATGLGLVQPAPGDRNYLAVKPGDAKLAAKAITAPAPVVQQALVPDPATGAAPAVAAPSTQAQAPATTQPQPQAPVTTQAAPVAQTAQAPQTAATPVPQATAAPVEPAAGGVTAP